MLMIMIQNLILQNTVSLTLCTLCPIHLMAIHTCSYNTFLPLAASIDENTIPTTQPLLTVTATDADSDTMGYGTVTYSIEDDDGTFTINNMGEISVNMTLDRESS